MVIFWFCVLLGAVLWRMGGGAFTALTGLNFGTAPARGVRAALALLIAPHLGFYALPAVLALFIGVCEAGWAPFQGMGLPAVGAPEASWKRWLPERLGFAVGTFDHDFIGMAESGVLCLAPLALVLSVRLYHPVWWPLLAGLLFAPAYGLARMVPFAVPKFAAGQEWGEVFTGAILGAFFMWSVSWSG